MAKTRADNLKTGSSQASAVPKSTAANAGRSTAAPPAVPLPSATSASAAAKSLSARAAYTTNQQIYDEIIRHHMNVLRFSSYTQKELIALFNRSELVIGELIKNRLATGAGLASPADWNRLTALMERIAEVRGDVWSNLSTSWTTSLKDLAALEPKALGQIVSNASIVRLQLNMPTARQLNAIVNERPFQGRLLKDWVAKINADDVSRIQNSVQTGMLMGETAPVIARRVIGTGAVNGVDGVTQMTRRELETMVRTSIQSIANAAREAFFLENEDIITGEQYIATLDSRTTVQCAALDGQVFPVGEGPIPPIHINCRSARVVVLDGEELYKRPAKPTTERQMLDEFTEKNDLAPVKARDALPRGFKGQFDSFQRERVRELTGQVPAGTTYQAWLERQPASFQNEVLGKTKGELFRKGGLTLDKFIDKDASPLSITELRAKYPEAFSKIT
jgi:SPP1 gp7 family putative phage head morphogenesis protein